MNIWRIHLKADAKKGTDQRKLCIENGVAGVGWQIAYDTTPVEWDTYHREAEIKYGDKSWRAAINAIKHRIQIDDLLWTRDWQGNYYLGRVTSDWFYETSQEWKDIDTVNVRRCEWHKVGILEAVPGKVVSSFIASRAIQIINDSTASYYSQVLYNERSNTNYYQIANLNDTDLFSLLSYDDCEDALALYLQVNYDYLVVPSSCKSDTAAYEFVLKHRQNGNNAVAQVKSGDVKLCTDDYSSLDTIIFLFATSGQYLGTAKPNIHIMNPEDIRAFLYSHTHLLPDKMKKWVELTRQ